MKKLFLDEIKRVINTEPSRNQNCLIEYVSNDIKNIKDNSVIFHINRSVEINERKFSLLTNCFIVTDQPLLITTIKKENYIFVDNVESAYKTFINYYRNLFNIPVVAVTGTCGKTTTKEMISQVLKNKYNVVHTISSKNSLSRHNDYLMSIDENTQFGVFETAITHPGHLNLACDIFKPSIGIITTIGIDHLNKCKTIDNYTRTKGEMLIGLKNKGTLIINNDDKNIKKIDMSNYRGNIITFGIKAMSDFYGKDIRYSDGGMTFILVNNNRDYKVYVPGYGEHNVYNALGALAALNTLGMALKEAIQYLSLYKPIKSHVEFQKGIYGSEIIDDTWSSNPTSMKAAFKVLQDKGKDRIKIAVLGKIEYLGKFEQISYEKIAKMLIKYNIDMLITQDNKAKLIAKYAIMSGMNPEKVISCEDKNELLKTLEGLLNEKTLVLFKCSMLDKSNQEVLKSIIIK